MLNFRLRVERCWPIAIVTKDAQASKPLSPISESESKYDTPMQMTVAVAAIQKAVLWLVIVLEMSPSTDE
tara:strand:+ start:1567 stop:1776 length:210 start_codon:yes stop_codon:yes gene_type:complete